jgi:hypothetical protein
MHAALDVDTLPVVVMPSPQVLQLELLLAGPPADHVPGPHSAQDGPAKPGLQPAVRHK